jgi:CPA1 family monovalent cation:H+ antiporter
MNEAQFALTVFIALLLVASAVAMAAKWVRVPYTLMLVIVGLIISPMHFLPPVHISPELILLIFLPSLLFEAAWNLNLGHLRKNLGPILMLAVPGVIISVGVIGAILHWGAALSWPTALLFGSMISATDPVSVLAIFKKLGLPQRLSTIVEGESLLNDGTAVVVFRILLGLVTGAAASNTVIALHSLREFALVVFGGIAVGVTIGIVASTLTSYFDDHLLEITLTTIAAYGSFLLAETLHVSPVIAVLLAGLVIGNYGRRVGMSPTTQMAVNSFWEYAAFVVNSLVFLLIGLEVQTTRLLNNLSVIAWAVLAMLGARLVAVYLLMASTNRFAKPLPLAWQHILFWGGLRGSLSMALALSLPIGLADRERLIVMTFGAVIFSLLAQGLTINRLLRWLKLGGSERELREYELLHGLLLAEAAALVEVENLKQRGVITRHIVERIKPVLDLSYENLNQQLAQQHDAGRRFEEEQLMRLQRYLIDVKKARMAELLREGILSEPVYGELIDRMDRQLEEFERANVQDDRQEAK